MERIVHVVGVERDEGTLVIFQGEDVDTLEGVVFAADFRPAQDMLAALAVGAEDVLTVVPDYMTLRVLANA